jgi:hypothetical protein
MLCIYCIYILLITSKNLKILYILTTDLLLLLTVILTNNRPILSSERAHHMDKTITV